MHTQTLLDIISIIDNDIYDLNSQTVLDNGGETEAQACILMGKRQALSTLRTNIQSILKQQSRPMGNIEQNFMEEEIREMEEEEGEDWGI